eukprot:TRINITY_DN35925_c0_g1_i1.p1 TRINITY_DN35925_c0_g1~~TRINITY_DN35925_c0_g1_i1.p1  ORF type:complete len:953 (-),score=180.90 TRINITY_DN35925_c0_g1_i1:116-2974(-)
MDRFLRSASAPSESVKRPRIAKAVPSEDEFKEVTFGSVEIIAFSTVRLESSQLFPTEQGGFSRLLTPNRPLELQWVANAKPVMTKRGKPVKQSPEAVAQARAKASSIRLSAYSQEIGKCPSDVAQCLVPLLLQERIEVSAKVGPNPPSDLELGTSIPVILSIKAGPAAWSPVMKSDIACASEAARERAEWNRIVGSIAMPQFLKLLDLKLKYKALPTASSAEPEGDVTLCDAEVLETELEQQADMPSEVAAQLGNVNALERLTLPAISIAPTIFKTSLRSYQAQAVFWMWARENPGVKLQPHWMAEAAGSKAFGKEIDSQVQLDPSWEEYELHSPAKQPLYFNRFTGTLSHQFPAADLEPCRGGILADDMGLGKTVTCLALMAMDRAPDLKEAAAASESIGERATGGTLVVLPVSLLHQWQSEISLHFPFARKPSTCVYYGTGPKSQDLASFDVVLTTYGTIRNTKKSDSEIMRILWRRIILDEAHIIKNSSSKTAEAIFELQGVTRWAVTGTPMQNNVDELYSLVRFLGVQPWSARNAWKHAISESLRQGDIPSAVNEARRILEPLVIRRTKATLDPHSGQPLVQLPPKHMHVIELDFSPAERTIYDGMYRTVKEKFDNLLATDQVLKCYAHVLLMLLALRRATCHPFLAFAWSKGSKPQDRSLEEFAHRISDTAAATAKDNRNLAVTATHDSELVRCLVDSAVKRDNLMCLRCGDVAEEGAHTAPCGHVICRMCINMDAGLGQGCLWCQQESAPLCGNGELPEELQSSKIRAVVKALSGDVASGRCSVVFSQWPSFLQLIGRALDGQSPGVQWRCFDGSHSSSQRQDAQAWFKEGESKSVGRVLLVSLMAGCVGLNLISASRLYMMDLWWNPSIENQAINRIHRIGQTKEVHIYKFVVRDSIDLGIMSLQRSKALLCEALMDAHRAVRGQHAKLGLDDFKTMLSHGVTHG